MADASACTKDAPLPAANTSPGELRVRLNYAAGGLRLRAAFTLSTPRGVLFGPSGAGKSTLLRLLAGLLKPAEGLVTFNGRVLTDTAHGTQAGPAHGVHLPAGQRSIGYLTQHTALFPHLSVAANIAFGLHALTRAARRERTRELIESFRLDELAHRRPGALSGGEQRRVALAQALAPGPQLLLLDEPFTGLDQARRQETQTALELWLEQCPAMVLTVSHDVAEVYASGAEVIVLESGEVTAQGPARDVLEPLRQKLLRQLDARAG